MENSNGKDRATNDRVYAASARVRVPPLEPENVLQWFSLLERQFELSCITDDKLKFDTTIKSIGCQYPNLVADIVYDPQETGRYERLKSELIKQLTNRDALKVWKLLQDQKIENRTPSQFYNELKRLATTFISDDLILILWISRLPTNVQQTIEVAKEIRDVNALTEMADRICKIWYEPRPIPAVSAGQPSEQSNCASDTLHDRISRLEAQTKALILDHCRPTSLQQPNLYHKSFSDCANKCHYPCNWNQNENQGNAAQSSVIAKYDVDMWGSIYAKDTLSEYSFLVDTGSALSTFPRNKLPACSSRIKDENYYLIGANGTRINTYGPIQVYLNLSSIWKFQWQFIVADVNEPTIGMDFMQYHGFLVDTRNKCLFKQTEPPYGILCHGCHSGINTPHKPHLLTNPSLEFWKRKRPPGVGRGSLHDAECDSSATFTPRSITTRPRLY